MAAPKMFTAEETASMVFVAAKRFSLMGAGIGFVMGGLFVQTLHWMVP